MCYSVICYLFQEKLGYLEGPLELPPNDIKLLKDKAKSANKDPSQFKIILGASPAVTDLHYAGEEREDGNHRFPLTGTIEQIYIQ
jgi:hypothetical protein